MSYTLRYRSSRGEVWRWYWRTWRRKFWFIHVLVAIAVGFSLSRSTAGEVHIGRWILCSALLLPVVTLFFAAVPQVMFKSAERVLEVGPDGWATQIGKKKGSRPWSQVASIREEDGAVAIVGTNSNALIVPSRAFASQEAKEQFVNDTRHWHLENGKPKDA